MPIIYKVCTTCKKSLPSGEYYRAPNTRYKFGYMPRCKSCTAQYNVSRDRVNDRSRLYHTSKGNARSNNIEHTIKPTDIVIPDKCPYLGVTLYRHTDASIKRGLANPYSPSIDRIDPSKGYIPGNIQVISQLANCMKTNATLEQLIAFATGVFMVHGVGRS